MSITIWLNVFAPAVLTAALVPSNLKPTLQQRQRPYFMSTGAVPASYCGLCCLHRAMQVLHITGSFERMLRPEYISSPKGSSIADLEHAARDHGIIPTNITRMTCRMLRTIDCPAILHVEGVVGAQSYNHWILFAGTVQGKAKIYDGEKDFELEDFGHLRARWDGNALLLFKTNVDQVSNLGLLWGLQAAEPTVILCAVLGAIAITMLSVTYLAGRVAKKKNSILGTILWQAAGIVATVTLIATVFSMCNSDEALGHQMAINEIQDAHMTAFLPHVTVAALDLLRKEPDVTLIDARQPADFETAHIPRAVNIPPGASLAAVENLVPSSLRHNRVVIYCQSSDCPYSAIVARKLRKNGFTRLYLYKPGFIEWSGVHYPLAMSGK